MEIHKDIYEKLDYFYQKNHIPNIIFHGSNGCGKKTLLMNFLNKIYDRDTKKIKNNVMIVNCSHGKGIKFIREELKLFAKMNLQYNSNVRFKSIVLLNADSLTNDAQSALRRCIEQFSYNTRFFIVIENKERLLNPIISRFCIIFVPEYMENGKVVNLHQYQNSIDITSQEKDKYTWFNAEIEKLDKNHVFLTNLCDKIYNQGYSCCDMIDFLRTSDQFPRNVINDFVFEFNRIKCEFKNECFLIFYMLDYIFMN
jgi:DNA polymerase III delta prime subunit